jgi:peptidoglycan L-alanyl-D-glutamate endopeptidase CwlK
MIKIGATGEPVRALQLRLLEAGFNPGPVDGVFGAATEAAVMAFQHSQGLLADGVAGPRTLAALRLVDSDALPDIAMGVTLQAVSHMFPSTPLGNIKKNLPVVLSSLSANHLGDRPMVLMALATIRAEAEPFLPLNEGLSRFNTSPDGHPFDLYDNRRDLGNTGKPDGERYRGRGFIQLTGRHNYKRYGPRLSTPVDLESSPDLALDSKVAADLLCLFLRDKELAIKTALVDGDLRAARRLVNGGSHGLDRFADAYNRGNEALPASL